jgi:hypothetical protein
MLSLAKMHEFNEIHALGPAKWTWNSFLAIMATLPDNNTLNKIKILNFPYIENWDWLPALAQLDVLMAHSRFRCVEHLHIDIRKDPEQAQDVVRNMPLAKERGILYICL